MLGVWVDHKKTLKGGKKKKKKKKKNKIKKYNI